MDDYYGEGYSNGYDTGRDEGYDIAYAEWLGSLKVICGIRASNIAEAVTAIKKLQANQRTVSRAPLGSSPTLIARKARSSGE